MTDLSSWVESAVERGWVYGSLMFGDTQVRTGTLLLGMLKTTSLRAVLVSISRQFERIQADALAQDFGKIVAGSPEDGQPATASGAAPGEACDVFLDVPLLKVDEIDLEVEDLRARVSLQAEVLDLLKLNVGADVVLGRVHLGISGVEAQARLTVRLDNVASIINRVLTTLDRNPEILRELARGVGSAVQDVGGDTLLAALRGLSLGTSSTATACLTIPPVGIRRTDNGPVAWLSRP